MAIRANVIFEGGGGKTNALIGITHSPDDDVGGSKILRAIKLIYREAQSFIYSHNVFLFMEPQALRIFASCIGDNKAMLRQVQLNIGARRLRGRH